MESADRSGIDFRILGALAVAVVLLVPVIAAGLQQLLLNLPFCYSGEHHNAMKIMFMLGLATSAGLNLPLLYLLFDRERIAQKQDIKISIGIVNGLLLVSLLVAYLIRCFPLQP
jgi:hypothetical protein